MRFGIRLKKKQAYFCNQVLNKQLPVEQVVVTLVTSSNGAKIIGVAKFGTPAQLFAATDQANGNLSLPYLFGALGPFVSTAIKWSPLTIVHAFPELSMKAFCAG